MTRKLERSAGKYAALQRYALRAGSAYGASERQPVLRSRSAAARSGSAPLRQMTVRCACASRKLPKLFFTKVTPGYKFC